MARSIVRILWIIVITANPSKATSTGTTASSTTQNAQPSTPVTPIITTITESSTVNLSSSGNSPSSVDKTSLTVTTKPTTQTLAASKAASSPPSTSLTQKVTSSDQPHGSTTEKPTSGTSKPSSTMSAAGVISTIIQFTGTQKNIFTGSLSTVPKSEQQASSETNENQATESSSTEATSVTPSEQLSSTDTQENQTSQPSSTVATGDTTIEQLSSTETNENNTGESFSTVASIDSSSEEISSTDTHENPTSLQSSTVTTIVTPSEQLSSTETSDNPTGESFITVASNDTSSKELSSTDTHEIQTSQPSSTEASIDSSSEEISSTDTHENQTSEPSSTVAIGDTTIEQLSSSETNQTQTSETSPTVANGFQTGLPASLGMYNATILLVTPKSTINVLKPTTDNSYLTNTSNLSMTTDNTILESSPTIDINYSTKAPVSSVSQNIASTVQFQTSTPALTMKDMNISVSIHSSPFVVGQSSGVISCSFQRNLTSNNQSITWSKNGATLYNPEVVAINTSCNGELHCESNLTLHEVNILSKGEYKCDVQIKALGVNYRGQATTKVTVKQKPVLVIKPIRTSVLEGENVSVNCNVTNMKDAYLKNDTVIKMCYGNMTEVRNCNLNSTYDSTCNFVVVSTMTIKCGLSNCSYNNITSKITVVSKEKKLCKNDNQWPSTQEGQEASIPCPGEYLGEVTRKCQENGIWEELINSENCTQAELKLIENILNSTGNLTADVLETSLSSISSIVNKNISSSNENKLADNDIKQSVDLISTISEKTVHFTDQEAANKTTQVFMGIVSDILKPGKYKNASTDTNKKDKEKEVTRKILASVNSFAKSVTKALKVNQTVTVKKSNMWNEVAFTAVKYDDIGSEFISENHKQVGSSVLSLTVDGLNSQSIIGNITLSFQRKNDTGNSTTDCVFLNNGPQSVWNTSGCSLENFTDSQVTCSCNHLTNFAILMSYTDVTNKEISKEDIKRLKIISVFGCSLSIMGAFVTIVLYIYFWRYIKSRRSTLVINLCSALCIAYLLFLTAVEHSENKTGCIIIAALLHYFFLAMFTTMLCLGIDLAVAVFDVFSSRSRSAVFLLVSWGLPAAVVGITLGGSQLEGYGDETYCWLRHTTLFGFIVPVLCIVLVNLIIVIVVMRKIYTSSFMMKKSLKEKTLNGLRGICGLLPILGLTWVFGIFSVNQNLIIFQYLFAIFNSLQGLFIFLFYVALNPQMREAVARKIKIYESRSSISKTSKTTKFVSTSNSEEEHEFSEREDGVAASKMYIIPRCSAQNKQFNKRQ